MLEESEKREIEEAAREVFGGKKIRVKEVFDSSADYITKVELKKGKPVLYLNLRQIKELRRIMRRGYLRALLAHEEAHLRQGEWRRFQILLPEKLAEELGFVEYANASRQLDSKLDDFIADAYAIAITDEKQALEYIELQAEQLKDVLAGLTSSSDCAVKAFLMIPAALLSACCTAFDTSIEEVSRAEEMLTRTEEDKAIFSILENIFLKVMVEAKGGSYFIDLALETGYLREALLMQKKPLICPRQDQPSHEGAHRRA